MLSVKARWRVILTKTILGKTTIPISNVGTVGTTYANVQNWSAYNVDPVMTVKNGSSLEVKGSLVLNGLDIEERLKTIEKVLGLPERDATMEAKYPSLKKKYDEYVNALAKYRTFDAIKGES